MIIFIIIIIIVIIILLYIFLLFIFFFVRDLATILSKRCLSIPFHSTPCPLEPPDLILETPIFFLGGI